MKFFDRLFRKKILADCGHKTLVKDWVTAFGEAVITRLPIKNGGTSYCHKCIEKMAIRCAWCGKAIFIGDAVTLYTPNRDFQIPDYAVFFSREPIRLVGCLRWECASSGADRSGFWMPPGAVERMPSPIEMAMASTDPIVILNDVSDRKETLDFLNKISNEAKNALN